MQIIIQQEQTNSGQLALNGDAEAAMVKVEDSGTIETNDQANAESLYSQLFDQLSLDKLLKGGLSYSDW